MSTISIQNTNSYSLSTDEKKIKLLKDTFCKGATNEEFMLFIHACERTKLDPFMRQIYAVKRWDNTLQREGMTIQTGIDGYRLIAERTGCYSPGREPSYTHDANNNLESSTAYVKKMTKDGTWHEVAATAFFDEYCQRNKENKLVSMWRKMARNQLAKCAEALALRKAFPAELSGIYTKEEMEQADISVIEHIQNETPKMLESISKEKAQELQSMLDQCDGIYVSNVTEYYSKKGITEWVQMGKDEFNKLYNNVFNKLKGKPA